MNELARRLARGEAEAFAELYDACADRLHHYLTLRLGATGRADDVLQETFLRLVRSRDRLTTIDNLNAYIFQMARNEAIRYLAKEGRCENLVSSDLFEEADSAEAAAREAAETVSVALTMLSEDQREVVVLKHYSGLTFREIGDVTGVPTATAATRYRAALELMRGWLTRQST
jgi:RNA polymerase sigma-70 factor, ECF subfamily